MHWYAVNTKPRQENLAELTLQRLGVETFNPRLKQNRLIRKRLQTIVCPLFPGYLFARFNLGIQYRTVNFARGVQKIVSFGSTPATVDEEMVESIKSMLQDGCVIVQTPSFSAGQTVRVQSGPLKGLEAIFEREMGDRQRAVLLLKTLSYQARVVVDLDQVVNL
jgi:transcriptional antiterminator RfaH